MNTLSVDLENCFGIGRFRHDFKFSEQQTNTFLIYAPNGTMKTSFAKTFDSLAKNDPKDMPRDRVYVSRTPKHEVLVDGQQIISDSILVINAENETIDSSEKISSFLASKELKKKYEEIYKELELHKKTFITNLKGVSKSNDCEKEIVETFLENDDDTFFDVISRTSNLLTDKYDKYEFKYNSIFDTAGKVKAFLEKNKEFIELYMINYTELLTKSSFFKNVGEASFGTIQANQILKSIEDNTFFNAGHKFVLEDGTEINDSEQLRVIVEEEIEKIVNNAQLKKIFQNIDKSLSANVQLKEFKGVIEKDNLLLAQLSDYDGFKEKVWISFLSELKTDTESLTNLYRSKRAELESIINEAKKESKLWKQIIDTFNARFYVPFKVVLTNHEDVILKKQSANLEFHYFDKTESVTIKKKKQDLLEVLSRGERRAYFILQFLFEIESRKNNDSSQLLVLDDVADSFDYKNKYAIIEYINELHSSDNFKMLILTHNFDFYRTVSSRLGLRKQSSVAIRDNQGNVFLSNVNPMNDLFKNYLTNVNNPKVFISLIAFARNIIDYTDSNKSDDYFTLTACLHLKENSSGITVGDIFKIYKNRFIKLKEKELGIDPTTRVLDFIFEIADNIIREKDIDEINLENKIILAIASRLKAENYMLSKLPDLDFSSLKYNQTRDLAQHYQKSYPDSVNLEVIDRVNLMTPENIHVNSFMYEPLLDMSVLHLVETYRKTLLLN